MRRSLLYALAAVLGLGGSGLAQTGPIVIAVLPFEDRGSYGQDKEVFRALRLGIPATLAGQLSSNPGVRVVDRALVTQAIQAQELGPNARVDAATAARIGGQVGARYAVTGNFADFYGKFRVDARIVEVESGQILKVVSNDDPNLQDRVDLFRIIQALAGRILAAVNLPGAKAPSPSAGAIPTEALTQYSLGLLYESQGDKAKAGEHYQRALTAYPGYSEAKEGMQRVRGS